MKITFVLPPVNMGGGIKVAIIYANELTNKGHECVQVSTTVENMQTRCKIKSLIADQGWQNPKWGNLTAMRFN